MYHHGFSLTCFIRLQIIKLDFLRFDVDEWGLSHKGLRPLYVYDGPTSASPLLGKFHERTLPGAIVSSSDTLFVYFYSNPGNHYSDRKGFEIKYAALEFNDGKSY